MRETAAGRGHPVRPPCCPRSTPRKSSGPEMTAAMQGRSTNPCTASGSFWAGSLARHMFATCSRFTFVTPGPHAPAWSPRSAAIVPFSKVARLLSRVMALGRATHVEHGRYGGARLRWERMATGTLPVRSLPAKCGRTISAFSCWVWFLPWLLGRLPGLEAVKIQRPASRATGGAHPCLRLVISSRQKSHC